MKETIINYFENIIKKIQPDLSDEDAKDKALKLKEAFEHDNFLDLDNPLIPLLLLFCNQPNVIEGINKTIIKSFKDKTGVEATFEDIKLYEDLESEINIYKQIKNFLESGNIDNIPPILTLILSCKDLFITPLNDKINVLQDRQKQIINKYETR